MNENNNSNNLSLQQTQTDATITSTNANDGNAAGAGASEDAAQGNAYQATIDQQASTIDTLIAANERLQRQMQQLLRNGGVINDSSDDDSGINPPEPLTPEQIMSKPDYEPLASLGKDIGKKPAHE